MSDDRHDELLAEARGRAVVLRQHGYPGIADVMGDLAAALRAKTAEIRKVRESRDDWRTIAEQCRAGTVKVTEDDLDGWLTSLRSGNNVIFGHAQANGLADEIERLRDRIVVEQGNVQAAYEYGYVRTAEAVAEAEARAEGTGR